MAFPTKIRGSAVRVTVETKRYNLSNLEDYNPSTSMLVTIKDPMGNNVVTNQSMTTYSTGKHFYIYQSSDTHELGYYEIIVTAVDGGVTTIIKQSMAFQLIVK